VTGIIRIRLNVILLLCTAFLVVRTSGDHLHLCFDGTETAVALHGADGGLEHASPDVAGGHHDVDVDLFHASLTRNGPHAAAFIGLPFAASILPHARSVELDSPLPHAPIPASQSRYFQPPLRGPPPTTVS
jgi:hypothetical protein